MDGRIAGMGGGFFWGGTNGMRGMRACIFICELN